MRRRHSDAIYNGARNSRRHTIANGGGTSMRERAGDPPRDASTRVNYRVRATDSRTSVTRPRNDDDDICPAVVSKNEFRGEFRRQSPCLIAALPHLLRKISRRNSSAPSSFFFPPSTFFDPNKSSSLKIFSLLAFALRTLSYYSSFNFPRTRM